MERARFVVGIDLGTTHTVVAYEPLHEAAPNVADTALWPEEGSARIFPLEQLTDAFTSQALPVLPSSLFAPVSTEAVQDPWGDGAWVVGTYAREQGARVPGRYVSSAKSWLSNGRVDRQAPLLPWGEVDPSFPRISPVEATARILRHVRNCWRRAFPHQLLEDQSVVVTIPASFDEGARELTLQAAADAGLRVRLLEEPQAAFYDWMAREPSQLTALVRQKGGSATVLVCDVGGGTTDLSLLTLHEKHGPTPFRVARKAVGRHLLLGGDNMDLALAHLCERRWERPLEPARFHQLVLLCRRAKEELLGSGPEVFPIRLLGEGSQLVGHTLAADLTRDEVQATVVAGFFPTPSGDEGPHRARSGLTTLGLVYERDSAVTRHVARFVAEHAEGRPVDAVLFNGGVFKSALLADRVLETLSQAFGAPVPALRGADPDLAVARGAARFGRIVHLGGQRIESNAVHGYYIGLPRAHDAPPRGVCILPQGSREMVVYRAQGRRFALLLGKTARFDLFAAQSDRPDRIGDVVDLEGEQFAPLPALTTFLANPSGDAHAEIEVELEAELSAVGTLEIACVEVNREPVLRHRLAFELRSPLPFSSLPPPPSQRPPPSGARLTQAKALIEEVFGKRKGDADVRAAKDLWRELERTLGERSHWTLPVLRELADDLLAMRSARRRSAEHERAFWQLIGYCMHPGFGHATDPERIAQLSPLFGDMLAFSEQARGWQQFWVAMRRVAGGLPEKAQEQLRADLDPYVAPSEKRLKKRKGKNVQAIDFLLETASSLERVSPGSRAELGGYILERTWTTRDPRLWANIGRIGARVPTYASTHHVVVPYVAEQWLDHLLREKWETVSTAAQAAVRLARMTGDRARDISPVMRKDVAKALARHGAPEDWITSVVELVALTDNERSEFYGEGLPPGLRLIE